MKTFHRGSAFVALVSLGLLLAPSVAIAASITIEEIPDELSPVEVTLSPDLADLSVLLPSAETVFITGFLTQDFITPGTAQVILVEPDGITFSDILTVSAGPVIPLLDHTCGSTDSIGIEQVAVECQRIGIFFSSDIIEGGGPLLALALADPVTTRVIETGGLQDLTASLGLPADTWTLQVRSDLEQVPMPYALVLVSLGLVVLGVARRNQA